MKTDQILKIYGTDYKDMTKALLAEADLAGHIGDRARRIAIKPNLVSPIPAEFGGTTHPEVVAGIIEYLKERDFEHIVIMEGSWVGDRTEESFLYCGYTDLADRYGVKLIDTQKEKSHRVDAAGLALSVVDAVEGFDFLINVPVLKGHCQTKVTCALKNLKGLLPNAEKSHFHAMGLYGPIAHLNAAIHQDFIVVDHICGDPDFEDGGHPRRRDCVMAALDPVLVDSYACHLLGWKTEDVPYIGLAEALGVGRTGLFDGESGEGFYPDVIDIRSGERDYEEPISHHVLDISYAVEAVGSCSACYSALTGALIRLEEEGMLADLPFQIGIGQGMRGKKGKFGVGRCTKDFDVCIMGCPPEEEEIYQGLRQICEQNSAV